MVFCWRFVASEFLLGIRRTLVRRIPWIAAALMAAVSGHAVAASIDLGRIFDVGKDLRTAAVGMDETDEIAVGREVAGRTLGAAPLVADPELQAYVNRVGRWIAMQAERPDLPWHFGVLDTSSVNAFAAPGGGTGARVTGARLLALEAHVEGEQPAAAARCLQIEPRPLLPDHLSGRAQLQLRHLGRIEPRLGIKRGITLKRDLLSRRRSGSQKKRGQHHAKRRQKALH